MCWLKNLHFTLRGACAHLDHLATHSTLNVTRPLGCWGLRQRTCCFFPPLHSSTSRACTQFRGYLENQRQTKTVPPPTPPPIQRSEKRSDRKRKEERKSTLRREAGVSMQASTRPSKREMQKKGGEWKESGSHRDVSLKTWIECMCLLSQLITLYRGHGLTLYTTHTRSSGRGRDVSSNCSLFWKSEWISFAVPPNSIVCVDWCYPNSSREREA